MSDLEQWKVRGPVRSLVTHAAERDLARDEWFSLRRIKSATFRPDGKLDESRHYNPDGTIARHKFLYNQAGLLIERQFRIGDALSNQTLYSYDHAGRHAQTVSVDRDGKREDIEASTYDGAAGKPRCGSSPPTGLRSQSVMRLKAWITRLWLRGPSP